MKMPLLCLQPDNPGPNGTKSLRRLSIPIEIASHRSIKKTEARKIERREENFSIFFFSVAVMGTAMRGGGEEIRVLLSLSLFLSSLLLRNIWGNTLWGVQLYISGAVRNLGTHIPYFFSPTRAVLFPLHPFYLHLLRRRTHEEKYLFWGQV